MGHEGINNSLVSGWVSGCGPGAGDTGAREAPPWPSRASQASGDRQEHHAVPRSTKHRGHVPPPLAREQHLNRSKRRGEVTQSILQEMAECCSSIVVKYPQHKIYHLNYCEVFSSVYSSVVLSTLKCNATHLQDSLHLAKLNSMSIKQRSVLPLPSP